MSHDKTQAAARQRMAQTGEPYAAARRAVVAEQQAARAGGPPPAPGYVLRMSGEIHDWLTDLRRRNQPAALRVVKALVTLMTEGASAADPLVLPTADSWPGALGVALDRSYQERLDQLTAVRRGEADAGALVTDLHDHVAGLEAIRTALEDAHRSAQDMGSTQDAEQAVRQLAAVRQQLAEARRLLSAMTQARNRLRGQKQQLQARTDAFRARKETLKARYVAARGSLQARQAMHALDEAGQDGDQHPEARGETARAEAATLADITAQMERELGVQARPEGLMQLQPGAPWHEDIRILFAVEPPGAALLIAVMEGPEAVMEQYPEALITAADILHQVRAGQAPEAATHAYDEFRSFMVEFYPGLVGDLGADSSSP